MIGDFRHLVTVEAPGAPQPDGDGGYTLVWTPLTPATWWVSIEPATPQDQERIAAGSVITKESSLVTGHFHPGLTTAARLTRGDTGTVYSIAGVRNREERSILTEAIAVEVTP